VLKKPTAIYCMVAMNSRIEMTVVLTVLILTLQGMAISGSGTAQGETGWRIDAFTLKDPHSGVGPNVPSDAFSPDEDIQIFGKLTYNAFPLSNYLISFEISGPPDPAQNRTHLYTGQTNDSGITETPRFRGTTLGEWSVMVSAEVASGITINDSLTFKFDWIVRTTSLTTTNESFKNQTTFSRGNNIMININLVNIAMDEEDTTLSLEISDSLGLNIYSATTEIFVAANETPTTCHFLLKIPENAANGVANIYVNAFKNTFDSGGIPYCPQLESSFLIMHRNIAVLQVTPSSLSVFKNESVSINVKVRNDGEIPESFNVTVYRNATEIATIPVVDLNPSSESTLTAIWKTDQTEEGKYVIMANASSVPEGDDPSDNTATDGIVKVMQRIHDIALTDVAPLSNSVYAGQTLEINVTIKNKGTQTESTLVYLYYNNNVAGSWNISQIQAENQQGVILPWNTIDVPEGNYTISAFATPVEGEDNIADNTRVDGRVRIMASPASGFYTLNWIDWILLFLFLLMLILLIVIFFHGRRRTRQKKASNSFDSGWTAWYYGYQLQGEQLRE
jgi:CARDB